MKLGKNKSLVRNLFNSSYVHVRNNHIVYTPLKVDVKLTKIMMVKVFVKREYNRAVDWWSLGVVIYEMATGK